MMLIRADLRKLFLEWLDTLNTANISRDITFTDDFTPILGRERIRQLKGSTRIRAVLAFHAALIEVITIHAPQFFCFFIMDTPKQHEMHNVDLDDFMKKLKELSVKTGVQIVFSTTEYRYEGDEFDVEWAPKYPGEKQNMFMKVASSTEATH